MGRLTVPPWGELGPHAKTGDGPGDWASRVQAALEQARSFDAERTVRQATARRTVDDPADWTPTRLASCLDETLLRPEATPVEVEEFLRAAQAYPFAAVCVQPCYVGMARRWLDSQRPTGDEGVRGGPPDGGRPRGGPSLGGPTHVAAVVAFPHGASLTVSKVQETRAVVAAGADEVDMVANLGWIRAGEWSQLLDEIGQVVEAAGRCPVKVILECAALPRLQWAAAAAVAVAAGATFVKTSTGFGPGGARVEDVALLRQIVGAAVGVKAAGGIRQPADAIQMLRAGANRIGTSHGVAIVQQWGRAAVPPGPSPGPA